MDKYLYKLHIKGIQHIGIPTQKYQETLNFYRSLGFETINQENYQGHRVAFLRIHNVMLEVYESETTADATDSIISHYPWRRWINCSVKCREYTGSVARKWSSCHTGNPASGFSRWKDPIMK